MVVSSEKQNTFITVYNTKRTGNGGIGNRSVRIIPDIDGISQSNKLSVTSVTVRLPSNYIYNFAVMLSIFIPE